MHASEYRSLQGLATVCMQTCEKEFSLARQESSKRHAPIQLPGRGRV